MDNSYGSLSSLKGGIESEYFAHHKIEYFSRIDNGDESHNGSNADDKLLLSTRTCDTQQSISNGDMQKGDGAEGDAVAGSGALGKVASIKSLLSVSNIGSMNTSSSTANMNNVTAPQTPGAERGSSTKDNGTFRSPVAGNTDRFKIAMKSPLASASKRPKTTFITKNNATSDGNAKQSLEYSLLNDLNLDNLDLNVQAAATDDELEVPHWRMKERMKTTGVGLILALNIGTNPPDVIKPIPSAKLQCWMDPSSTSRSKALLKIGELLEAQYARWQGQHRSRIRYKSALDPTIDDLRNLCTTLRRYAKNERVLLHYNGHGVPRPTESGEIWLFDKNHTQYIPFPVTDLKHLVGTPSMVVLDCSGAGAMLPFFVSNDGIQGNDDSNNPVKNVIVLCPTSEHQNLPMNPELPADLFTSCLTTPILIALKWFVRQNPLTCATIDPDSIEHMPGKLNDRKTPLGELNWIFTAITDSIAWNVLTASLFQSLFRQDLMVASMFRNFLLADRILRELNCTPSSLPALPSTCNHPLWQAWDLAVETCLSQLMKEGFIGMNRRAHSYRNEDEENDDDDDSEDMAKGSSNRHQGSSSPALQSGGKEKEKQGISNRHKTFQGAYNISAPFFAEQLTSFEKWLEYAANRVKCGGVILPTPLKQHENFVGMQKMASFMYPGMSQNIESPEQLPVVLQVLLSPTHRVRALVLLRRFLYLGPSAINLALAVGICPYVLRLLQSSIDEYKHLLVGIWSKILFFDHGCKNDLVKDVALPHFIRHLEWDTRSAKNKGTGPSCEDYDVEDSPARQRTMAAVILAAICSNEPLSPFDSSPFILGQNECVRFKLHSTCCGILKTLELGNSADFPPELRMWLCICLGVLCKDNRTAQHESFKIGVHRRLFERMKDECSDVRAAACFALGCMISSTDEGQIIPVDPITSKGPPAKRQPNLGHVVVNNQKVPIALPWQQQQQHQQHQQQPFNSSQAQQEAQSYILSPLPDQLSPRRATSFQAPSKSRDSRCIDRDVIIWNNLLSILEDASPIVRYEASVVLGRLVRKYATTFVAVAKHMNDSEGAEDFLMDLNLKTNSDLKCVSIVWKKVRTLHKSDPHPQVADANTSILRFVNEKQFEHEKENSGDSHLDGCDDDDSHTQSIFKHPRAMSSINLSGDFQRQTQSESLGMRTSSLVSIVENSKVSSQSMSRSVKPSAANGETFLFTKDNYPDGKDSQINSDSDLPKSWFYEWKKELFQEDANLRPDKCGLDPLCEEDAIILHREQRNAKIDARSRQLSEKYAVLRPLPKRKKSVLDVESDEPDEAEIALETEISLKKKSLNLKEKTLISYHGTKMTHLLRFHSYESILAASDGANNISVWNIKQPNTKMKNISNGNAGTVKMTSMSWMNERNHSLLLTGCDDGSVRVWDNVVDNNPDHNDTEAVLATSFYALPELKSSPGPLRGSGLVTEWQQSEGRLIAGGNTNIIRCWDVESEKCSNIIDSQVHESCATSFVTAWDYIHNGHASGGFSGLGPDIMFGGYGDGKIKVFDLRLHVKQGAASSMNSSTRRKKSRLQKEHVHKNWIVNIAYTHSPTKYEVGHMYYFNSFAITDLTY